MNEEEKAALDKFAAKIETMEKTIAELKAKPDGDEKNKEQITKMETLCEQLKTGFDDLTKGVAELKKAQDELAALQAKSDKNKPTVSYRTLDEAIAAGVESVKAEIAEAVKKAGKGMAPINFEIEVNKLPITMSNEAGIGSNTSESAVILTDNTGQISTIRRRALTYRANVSVGSMTGDRALWIVELDEQGAPTFIGEGDSKAQASVRYEERNKNVKKVAVYGKVTMELMADTPQLISYIKNNLMRRLDIKEEDGLFNGDDTGDNLAGLYEFDTAFTGGGLASQVETPNEFDVLEALALQVEEAFGIANAVFVHPSTWAKMKVIKDTTGRPVWKDYVTIGGGMEVSGMKIIKTTAVTAGNFIGGDLSVVNVLDRESIGITIGLDGNDFTNNKKTMLCEKRMVQYVSENDTPLIVSGDFTTAKALIATA